MRKFLLLATCLAAACNQGAETPQNQSPPAPAPVPARAPAQTATVTGLYETDGTPPSQLCITEQGRAARFGLVIRRNGRPGCSGAGIATRNGSKLRLTMTGESPCAIEARIEGGRVTFPASLPSTCAYYCAPGIMMGSTPFEKTGGTREDALRARDAVGDRLCG